MIKHFLKLFVVLLSLGLVTSCDYDDEIANPDYVSLQFSPGGENVGVEVGGSTNYDVKVYSANITNQDRTYNVNVLPTTTLSADGFTVPATVTISGGTNEGTLGISVSDIGLGVAGKKLFLGLEQEPGFSVGAPVAINVARVCPGKEFVVDLVFDAYPGETGWELIDSDGISVISINGTATATRSLCLPNGTYTFILKDSYGDGIVDGGATLTYAGVVLATVSGDFEEESSVEVSF
jgi:hypothetical protein